MPRDPRYDILFEPVKIRPVTAKNRFYQVPHCSGIGNRLPQNLAAMRRVKAEGGWGVVCTEYCSIHPSADDSPFAYASLWDDDDIRQQILMTEAVHEYGALAGVELWHGGHHAVNRVSRVPILSPFGPAAALRASAAFEGDGPHGHPQPAALAGRCHQARAAGRLRHRLCLLAVPVNPQHSLKMTWARGVTTRIGDSYDTIGFAWQYVWF